MAVAPLVPTMRRSAAGPALDTYEVTPADGAELPHRASMLRCKGNAGDVRVITGAGRERVFPIEAGEDMPCIVTKVFATGTTATGLWAFSVD